MNTWFAQESYGDLPAEIIIITQMVTILYIVYFYQSFSNELKFGVHTFFVDGYKIIMEKITALLLVHISLQIMLMLTVYVVFTTVYIFVGIELSSIYVSLFRFLIDYMFFPLLFTAFIGLIIALIFGTNKVSIFFIIIIWFLSGVINQEIFSSFFETVGANDWKSLLSIGPNSIYSVYQPYMGFNVDFGLELRLFTWFLLFISIILVASLKWTIVKREKKIILFIVSGLFIVDIGSGFLSIQNNSRAFNSADEIRETERYEQLQRVDANLNYNIKAYDITLDGDDVRTEIKFDYTDTNKPSFQLYYAYPVHCITVDGKKVSYTREGDIIHINSGTDKFKKIAFYYKLADTALIPHSKNSAILLANHGWYPKKSNQHIFEKDLYLGTVKRTDDVPVHEKYFFDLTVDDVLFTNIDSQGDHYKGETNGLSLIKGQGNRLNYKKYDVIYPADWLNMSKRIEEVTHRLETIFKEIKLIAPMKVNVLPPNLVFMNDGTSNLISNDHLVYSTNGSTLAINDKEVMKDFERNLIALTVEQKGNREMYNEWINMSSQMIKKELGFPIYEPGPTIDLLDSSFEDIVNTIHAEFNLLSVEEKRTFLEQWYLSMDDAWTWENVNLLLEERKTN
ncbi:ABC transporter permease [Virgibacillus pantothenticus]|uniref:ABC transporter permease n=1 Tax=Virgibacillus pantothenticus TaxID=1473 RepID=UPI001BAF43D7|nr:ABC transporter permease [Virgibacillus pantothenticus]